MIISLSTDDSREEWLAKAPADRSNWKQYWATKHAKEILGNEYNVSAIPHFMLFGRDGKVIDIHAPSPSDKNIDKLCRRILLLLLPGLLAAVVGLAVLFLVTGIFFS